MKSNFKTILKNIPASPGVYKYLDKNGNVIYVGKAKDLKKRVSSYFSKSFNPLEKTYYLVGEISDIKYIVTSTEYEAFLLEMKLINEYKPKYNVVMRDDRSYPYLKITEKDPFPGIYYVRRSEINPGDFYVGPFIPSKSARKIMEIVVENFGIRTCKMDISKGVERPCLKYHLKKCLAPCKRDIISREDYIKEVDKAILFLKRDYKKLIVEIENEIKRASSKFDFEKAILLREQLMAVKKLSEKQGVFTDIKGCVLFISYKVGEIFIGVSFILVVDGIFKDFEVIYLERSGYRDNFEILDEAISSFVFERINSLDLVYFNKKFPSPLLEEVLLHKFKNRILIRDNPKGIYRVILNIAEKNIKERVPEDLIKTLLDNLKNTLSLRKIPEVIDAVDISNFGDKHVVGTVISFKNGKFYKRGYRRYRIKTFRGQDDFRAIAEVLERRYLKLKEDNLPDLLIVDGGKGQLSSASGVLKKMGIHDRIDVISIAKGDEIIYTLSGRAIKLDRSSPLLRFIQMLRNEVHRFSINYQRTIRDREFLKLKLTEIPTIGKIKAKKLIKEFGSIEEILSADRDDVIRLIGKKSYEMLKKTKI